jgi:UDPglucose--hexose-1-phosphate uridylyltransferase
MVKKYLLKDTFVATSLMHELELKKPDGRSLTLYSRRPIDNTIEAPSPHPEPSGANPHLRWHPLRGEWVSYAAHRQSRTFLPPPQYNPLLPSRDKANPTELPQGDYDVAVFDNLFPALDVGAHSPPELFVPTSPAAGHCEVVVFAQDPHATLGSLPPDHLQLLIEVFADRTRRIARHPQIRYVMPFENRGGEIGVTLHHPHGQIYAYPFVPPVAQRMHEMEQEHFKENKRALLETLIETEIEQGKRLIYLGPHVVAFVPAWARYPYEVWIAPRVAVPDFPGLNVGQLADLARALKTTLLKLDGLWDRPMPYLMAWYQSPINPSGYLGCHLHAEIYPAYRTRGRLKYLAGTEIAAGMFANDALPEEKARELQAVQVSF